jgi:aminoglycoside phosphotransferase family enzyme/predicted kinase
VIGGGALAEGLLRPEAYPWQPAAVELVETHVSWVFLAGDRVVKVKKPVSYGFVEHTALESRRRSCEDEVRLNRRLTDGVYLGVVPVVHGPAGYRVDTEGTPVEWATLMRRLPAKGMLDAILASGEIPPHLGQRLVDRLISFHRDAAAFCGGPADEAAVAASAVVTDNLTQLEPFAGEPLGPVQLGLVAEALRGFIVERGDLLRGRAAAGWIREGHGDLRIEHVCLEEGADGAIQIFDCVEFSRSLRCADVASDLAFLLMDLERLGAQEAAAALVARYRAAGLKLPDTLLSFYKAHRALVRAKVACLRRHAVTHVAARAGLAVEAADYLDLATAAAVTVRPALIAMTGLSGTGKSTMAMALARALGVPVFASDAVRKELAGQASPAPAAWERGLYAPERVEATYERLIELATQTLGAGRAAILDATFLDGKRRDRLATVARTAGVPLVLVETTCDEETAAGRILMRARRGDSRSDATVEVYRRQHAAALASPPPVPSGAVHVVVNTGADGPVNLDPTLAALRREAIVDAQVPDPDTSASSGAEKSELGDLGRVGRSS